ncbi:PH domain-containing protein [Vibrio vulnificus]|uniref:hypothetical protein n=1 Tax=Vibrio vulnificus TaxID=672 RepID=UPI0005C3D7D0|nr:hypothetical protein [Vibrio vulnificus]PWY29152.1 hypothetical protein VV86_23410 [Vibrio vulnificus]HAU8294398.1 hypothetical protein [Vibrio vulnificus]
MIKSVIIFIVSFLCSCQLYAKNPEVSLLHNWMIENYESIESNLDERDVSEIVPTIFSLVEIWKRRDGAISGEVSPLLLIALKVEPQKTLLLLSENPESFNKWLNELEGMVFTDHTGNDSDRLEQLRVDVLATMKSYSGKQSDKLESMADALIERLDAIRVRTID